MGVWSVVQISVIPPRLTPRSLQMATATTHVVVDTPRSSILDLSQDTYALDALRQRAIVLGNVPAQGEVRMAIAHRSEVPVDSLQVTPPLTPAQPRIIEGSLNPKHATDILASTDQYRMGIRPTRRCRSWTSTHDAEQAQKAEIMANAVVDELRAYLARVAIEQGTPEAAQISLVQPGEQMAR